MTELLAPAGSMEALKAAISNGCDAVYLGMKKFGARAYSSNFDEQTLVEAVNYAHLRGVKVYVTMNTIVFEGELEDMREQLDFINSIGVDGVIVQDLAVHHYITDNFEDMEAHVSTQMGIDDVEGTKLFKDLGTKRVVLAREVEIDRVKEIKEKSQTPIEIFVHGALCVSYSGNCLMSGLIGYRSGNRGRCVGSCRKPYELYDVNTGESLGLSYILSTKDLETIEHIGKLKGVDSLKIEGRMKEPVYVANVVSKYRKALDRGVGREDIHDLDKTFNRTYTKGYIFGEDKKDITNISRPNNYGYEIGRITGSVKGMYEISLKEKLNQNDIIRIDHQGEDVVLSVVKLYDRNGLLINSAEKKCYIKVRENLGKGDTVYKTKDINYYRELDGKLDGEFRRFPLDLRIYAYPEARLVIDAEGLGVHYMYESEEVLSEARNNPTGIEQVIKQFDRLNETIFKLGHVEFEECNAFIPAKVLNSARREIVNKLYDEKLKSKPRRIREKAEMPTDKQNDEKAISTTGAKAASPYLTASVMRKDQYEACQRAGVECIYFEDMGSDGLAKGNVIRRNQNLYEDKVGELLVGGYGGLYRYKDSNDLVTDYSFNVVNSVSCKILTDLGAKRVTLSYELNKKQIEELIRGYEESTGTRPSLEMIVYGRAPLMFTKYCPLKKMNLCGLCRKNNYAIRDEYGTFPIISHQDCTTTILNGKVLNLLDEMAGLDGIEAFRLAFTTETPEEITRIVEEARGKLEGSNNKVLFNKESDTRGHFNKEIL